MAGGFRQNRPGPHSGSQSGHKNLAPLASLIGGIGGGIAGGAAGDAATDASADTSSYTGNLGSATSGSNSITPSAPITGANGQINIVGAPYHPGVWANIATLGQAGLQAGLGQNNAFYQAQLQAQQQAADLAKQGLANTGQLDVTKQQGSNEINAAQAHSAIDYMAKNNMPYTPGNFKMASDTLFPGTLSNASTNSVTAGVTADANLTQAGLQATAYKDPDYYKALLAGTEAQAAMPYTFAQKNAITLNPNEVAFSNPTGISPSLYSGESFGGSTSTNVKSFDKNTGQMIDTTKQQVAPMIPARQQSLGPNGRPVIPIIAPTQNAPTSFSAPTNAPANISPSLSNPAPIGSNLLSGTSNFGGAANGPSSNLNVPAPAGSITPNLLSGANVDSGTTMPAWLLNYIAMMQKQQ